MNPAQDTLDLVKGALRSPDDRIAKTISTGTGLVAFDLQAPAKNLYPVFTPIRNVIPRVGGGTGTATNWRQVSQLIGSGFDAMGWVPEGQRSGQMSYTTATKSATFVTIGEEDAATYEAISAGRNFEDIQARMTFRLLQKLMLKEEMAILGGNASLTLGTPATPSLSASGTGATLPAATYYVKVVALTLEGYQNSSLSAGIATTKEITGADNQSYTLSGGSSNVSAEASQAVTLGQTLLATVTRLQGAVAYAWYVGTSTGGEKLEATTTINSVALSAPLAGTGQAQSAITADNSANADYAYDGLLTTALKSGSNAYVSLLPTGTAGAGTPLTSSGRGSVVEIDTMFQTMWNKYQLSPTVLYVNVQELTNITAKVLSSDSAPLLRYEVAGDGKAYDFGAAGVISFYFNPYALNGGLRIPIRIHPKVPPGTIIGWAENLPVQYQSNEVPNVAEVKARQDYYQIDWPDPAAPGRRLRRRGARGLRAVRDGGHRQYRQRLTRFTTGRARIAEAGPSSRAAPLRGGYRFGDSKMAFGDLTNLTDVTAWLQTGQNPFPAVDDTLLTRLITAASRFIESWLDRRVLSADWIETRDGNGGQRLAFANFPATAVLSVSIDGLAIPPSPPDGGSGAGYVFSPTELALRGYVFTRRAQNVVVTYTAGYAGVPPDIAQACIELVCQRYRERSRVGEVSKALMSGETVTFSQKDMSDDIKTLLAQYRAVAPASGFARTIAPTATDPAMLAAAL